MTFSLHQGAVVMSSQIAHTQLSNVHLLAHIFDTCSLIFCISANFYILSQSHHVTASNPSPGDNQQSTGRRSERTQGQTKCPVKLIQWHVHQGSPLFPNFWALSRSLQRHSSVPQGHLHAVHPA